MINIPKGTKDMLPFDAYKWQYIFDNAREVARLFNLKEIRTPIFEHTELFLRGVGETTDIVNKEMYTFLDKGQRSITLKPEGTAGVARSYIENNLANEQNPLKMFYFTPVFRYERPQAGRLREHHQFGVEIYGATDASMDAEVISIAASFFKRLGVENINLFINSIGCKECRPLYNKALKEFLGANIKNMCASCQDRFEKNPLRILDCKEDKCQEILKGTPSIFEFLCDDCKNHFEELKSYLKDLNLSFTINPRIVRGLDYYSKTVFEFVSDNIGAKGTVCGGGRYNGLIDLLGGKSCGAIGFGMGIERLLLLLESCGKMNMPEPSVDLYVAPIGDVAKKKAITLINELRQKGISCETDFVNRSIKANFKYADKIKAKYVLPLGENELSSGKVKLKAMLNSKEIEIDLADILNGKFEFK